MTNRTKKMRNQINDGGTAFPNLELRHTCGDPIIEASTGMSLRDYFAGQALAGYFAASNTQHRSATNCAEYIWEMADAMLTARNHPL